ncbi:MAG: hypothetical protein MK193_06330 [Lentisphaeria bacterium]|nr:hypothetical protein [Lentisphaeria bacterium]
MIELISYILCFLSIPIMATVSYKIKQARGNKAVILIPLQVSIVSLTIFYIYIVTHGWSKKSFSLDEKKNKIKVYIDGSNSISKVDGNQQNIDRFLEIFENKINGEIEFSIEYWAKNTTENLANLDTRASQLNRLFETQILRSPNRQYIVLSDGASTDGEVSSWVLEQLNEQEKLIYSFYTGTDTKQVDLYIEQVNIEPIDPKIIYIKWNGTGLDENDNIKVELRVDNKQIKSEVINYDKKGISIKIPDLKGGWHILETKVITEKPDISLTNNVEKVLFRNKEPGKFIYIYDRPRVEDRFIVTSLKGWLGDDLEVLQAPIKRQQIPANPELIILANPNPKNISISWLKTMHRRQVPILLLGGERTKLWVKQAPFNFTRYERKYNFYEEKRPALQLEIPEDIELKGFRYLDLDALELQQIQALVGNNKSTTVIEAKNSSLSLPFLLVDEITNPQIAIITSGVTWKWALFPNPEDNQLFDLLWQRVVSYVIGEQNVKHQVKVELIDVGEKEIQFKVSFTGEKEPKFMEVQLNNKNWKKLPISKNNKGVLLSEVIRLPKETEIIWTRVPSQDSIAENKRPWIINRGQLEAKNLLPKPEQMQKLTSAENSADQNNMDALIQKIIDDYKKDNEADEVAIRSSKLETILIFIIFILLGSHWFIERQLKKGTK